MAEKFKRINIPIKDLYLHPNNARFAEKIEFDALDNDTDKKAIERMIHLENTHMDKLLPDIAQNGILPSLLPIAMPFQNEKDKYIVYDANRRLSAIKLLVVYKNVIDTFNIPSEFKNLVKNLSYSGPNSILCMCSNDPAFINKQLTRIHTDDTGITQVKWTAQSQDYHLAEEGSYSNRYILDRFLSCSKYTDTKTKENLFIRGWRRQIENFIKNKKICEDYFGIKFDTNAGKMILFYNELTIVSILSHLVQNMIDSKAIDVAQSKSAKEKYLKQFREENPLLKENRTNPVIEFNAVNSEFEISTIESHIDTLQRVSQSQSLIKVVSDSNSSGDKTKSNNVDNEINQPQNSRLSDRELDKSDNINAKKNNGSISRNKASVQKFLIENNQIEIIKDKRASIIYEELLNLPLRSFHNISAIAFRSLFDLTIVCYLDRFCPDRIVFNNLPQNFKKVVSKLESTDSKTNLERKFPAIYMDIEKINNKECHSIKILNTITHNNGYHPTVEEVISIADNYLPFIYYVWAQIK